ncbi:MAG TPA: hypothetical protein VK395_15820 [Gemmataceae bacterium]|nr:hypothetical protein [Gemmataceae bacterium]
MQTCNQLRELLWEDLYGLLEADTQKLLREHLVACTVCQSELAQAKADQQALSEAARLNVAIPAFAAPADAATLPFSSKRGNDSRHWKQLWLWSTAAAALLALVLVPFGIYQEGLRRYQAALGNAEQQAVQVAAQREEVRKQANLQFQEAAAKSRAEQVCLQLFGPASYAPGSASPYQIRTADLDGMPAKVPLTARVLDADRHELWRERLVSNGTALVSLPPNLGITNSRAHLEIVALVSGHEERLDEPLAVARPALVTQLAIDKPVYQPGDKLFFRSLSLERHHLQPPNQSFTVTYALKGPKGGLVVSPLSGKTRTDGIGAGEFILPSKLVDGEYSLTETCADGLFPAVSRRFVVRSAVAAGVAAPPAAKPTSREPRVEFFPEGGDLVAGLPNRVYLRVRSADGQPADLDATLVDSKNREVARIQTVTQRGQPALTRGLGVFTFTPLVGETYGIRTPSGASDQTKLIASKNAEVALSVATPVTRAGEPIRVVLAQTATELPLLVGLSCRGRLVAEEVVRGHEGAIEVLLTPPPDCQGVLRITVFDGRESRPRPVAERLAYRLPAQRLDVSVKAEKDAYHPGEKVRLKLSTTNEAGKQEPAWLLVSVVNRDALRLADDPDERMPAAYFFLTSELQRAQDLEDANFLVSDDPRAGAALDLVLATQGWRRFPNASGKPSPASPGFSDGEVLVKRDNTKQVEEAYAVSLAAAQSRINESFNAKDRLLTEEGSQVLQHARGELEAYQARSYEYLRLATGLTALVCLVAGGFMCAVASARYLRSLTVRTRQLVGAGVALTACIALAIVAVRGPGQHAAPANTPLSLALARPWEGLAGQDAPKRPSAESTSGPGKILTVTPETPGRVILDSSPRIHLRPEIGSIRRSAAPLSPGNATTLRPSREVMPLPVREYAYLLPQDAASAGQGAPDTILWHPALFTTAGAAEVSFELPKGTATYQIRVAGNSATGRLGGAQQELQAR